MYKLKYIPLAQKDLRDIIRYIADNLKAPKAAMDLVDALESSIKLAPLLVKRLVVPMSVPMALKMLF